MEATKACGVCEAELPLVDFYKNKSGKQGRAYACKPCFLKRQKELNAPKIKEVNKRQREAHQRNKIERNKKAAERYSTNRDLYTSARRLKYTENINENREVSREWYRENKAAVLRARHAVCSSNYFTSKLPITDSPEFSEGTLKVTCKYCGKRFEPMLQAVMDRVAALSGRKGGEYNLYCSDYCKGECPLYGFLPDRQIQEGSKLFVPKTLTEKVRACAAIDRRELMRLQVDAVGYNYCEKCGTVTDSLSPTELHHTQEVAKTGEDAITAAGHLLLCIECHKEFTSMCRK